MFELQNIIIGIALIAVWRMYTKVHAGKAEEKLQGPELLMEDTAAVCTNPNYAPRGQFAEKQ